MVDRYKIRRRGTSLVVIEMFMVALAVAIWLTKKFEWDWIAGVLVFLGSSAVLALLFFNVRIFRYILSIVFSLIWSILSYYLLSRMTDSTVTPWIAAGLIFIVCIVLHKDYFVFERNAKRVEYDHN